MITDKSEVRCLSKCVDEGSADECCLDRQDMEFWFAVHILRKSIRSASGLRY
jgi:hypothetical protein